MVSYTHFAFFSRNSLGDCDVELLQAIRGTMGFWFPHICGMVLYPSLLCWWPDLRRSERIGLSTISINKCWPPTLVVTSVTSIQQLNGNGSVKFYETKHNLGKANINYLQLSINKYWPPILVVTSVTSIKQRNGNGTVNGVVKVYEIEHNLGKANINYLQLSISENKNLQTYIMHCCGPWVDMWRLWCPYIGHEFNSPPHHKTSFATSCIIIKHDINVPI